MSPGGVEYPRSVGKKNSSTLYARSRVLQAKGSLFQGSDREVMGLGNRLEARYENKYPAMVSRPWRTLSGVF